MKKAFVTGAAGLVGSHLVEELLEQNFEVVCLVYPSDDDSYLLTLPVKVVKGDVRKIKFKIPSESVVFHCAALTPSTKTSEVEYFKTNVSGTRNLVEACIEAKIEKFVYVSSGAACGARNSAKIITEDKKCLPTNSYGRSKLAAEQLLEGYKGKISIVIIRPFVLFGPRMRNTSVGSRLVRFAQRKYVPIVKGGHYEFTYVKNLVKGIFLASRSRKEYVLYNITDEPVKFENVIKAINPQAVIIPIPFAQVIASGVDLLGFSFSKTVKSMKGSWIADSSKMRRDFGYIQKYSFEEAIKDTLGSESL
jgi:2-alkyl-3-oxoalkanoate reductase